MEHRYSQRTHANIKVLLYKRGVPVAIGVAANISRHGVFVRTDYSDIGLHQPIEVEFLGGHGAGTGCHRFKSFVVHQSGLGLGLEIENADSAGQAVALSSGLG